MEITLSTLLAHTQLSRVNNPNLVEKNNPPIEGGIFIDPNADIYQQVASYFRQLGYEIPEQTGGNNPTSEKLEDIIQQIKNLVRELRMSGDKTSSILLNISEELASLASGTTIPFERVLKSFPVDNGRRHIGAIRGMIENIHNGYQKEFGKIIKKTTEFMQAVNTALGKMSNSVSRLLETFRQDNSHFDTLTQLLVQLIKDLNQYNNSLINI